MLEVGGGGVGRRGGRKEVSGKHMAYDGWIGLKILVLESLF